MVLVLHICFVLKFFLNKEIDFQDSIWPYKTSWYWHRYVEHNCCAATHVCHVILKGHALTTCNIRSISTKKNWKVIGTDDSNYYPFLFQVSKEASPISTSYQEDVNNIRNCKGTHDVPTLMIVVFAYYNLARHLPFQTRISQTII